ncbi:helix-turn-helix domain-containing protein [Sphaerisporangium dianthi]|uniref:Helix-turn-helix domain-containing protein n=1 Tax=Sphaerisporangium dianthi TaxID=1436120 RepID=A0ABV9C9W6_9ACTN
MPDRGSPTLRRQRLGRELRRLREGADMIGDDVAARLGWSAAKVSRVETAKTFPTPKDVEDLLELYRADRAVRQQLLDLRRGAAQKGWWEEYRAALPPTAMALMDREAEATLARNWEPQVIPGLLQTANYSRALMAAMQPIVQIPHSYIDQRVEARMARQQYLLHGSRPLSFMAVIDESVLRRQFGDAKVMREQLDHLVEIADLEHVEMRILTQETPPPTPTGPFLHLKFPDFPDVVYLEEFFGARFVEDAEQVFAYERAFQHLLSISLDEAMSQQLIRSISERWQ